MKYLYKLFHEVILAILEVMLATILRKLTLCCSMSVFLYLKIGESQRYRRVIVWSTTPRLRKNNNRHKRLRRFAVGFPKCRRSLQLTHGASLIQYAQIINA